MSALNVKNHLKNWYLTQMMQNKFVVPGVAAKK